MVLKYIHIIQFSTKIVKMIEILNFKIKTNKQNSSTKDNSVKYKNQRFC